jgi:hypothetical protein
MTMIPSADAFGLPARSATAYVRMLAVFAVAACAPAVSQAATYAGLGIAAFDGAGPVDDRSDGFEVFAGTELRPWLAIEGGVLQQDGAQRYDDVPTHFTGYDWRALYVGPRFNLALGERWQVHAGLALAHVAIERERAGVRYYDNDHVEYFDAGAYKDASWGALATLGLAVDLTPRQQLSLDYRRLHAGLDERCEYDGQSDMWQCGLLRHGSADGIALTWSLRFD